MATKAKKTEKFSPGKYVVHPFHGAAKIIRKVNKNVSIFVDGEPKSKRIEYYEFEILFDGLSVMVPTDKVNDVIRPVISKNAVKTKVLPIFNEKPEEAGSNWSRWYKVLTEKMTSGDVIQVTGCGGGGGFPSDRRLKKNINFLYQTHDWINIYTFEYKSHRGKYEGVIADEVENIEGAVYEVNGYKHVNYDKINVEFKQLK